VSHAPTGSYSGEPVSIFRAEIGIACMGMAKLLSDAYQVYFRVVCLYQRKWFDTQASHPKKDLKSRHLGQANSMPFDTLQSSASLLR
jgi:hypothetical protein